MTTARNDFIDLYGNGAELHDRIAGESGAYAKVEAAARAGRPIRVGVVRENAFLLDKIVSYAAGLTGRSIAPVPLVPSPVSLLPRRFDFHLAGLRRSLRHTGIEIEILDADLRKILEDAAALADRVPEPDILRLLGIVTRQVLVGPHWFVFEVENSCNEDCLYCNIHAQGRSPGLDFKSTRMPFEQFARQVDDLARMGVDGVTVLGNGEPTVHPRFIDMIEYAKERGLSVNFFTNGLLVKGDIARRVVASRCDEMFCTISAGGLESFLALHPRQTEKDWNALGDNLRNLAALKKESGADLPRAVAVHVICHENAHELVAMAKQAVELDFAGLRPQLIRLDEFNQQLALTEGDMERLREDLPRAKEVCKAAGVEIWDAFEPQLASASETPENWTPGEFLRDGCPIGFVLGLAKSNGDLSLCCVVKPVGNLAEGSVSELWYGPEYHRWRLAALDLERNRDLPLRDGTPLFTERCLRCDNHDVNRRFFAMLRDSGLIRFYRGKRVCNNS